MRLAGMAFAAALAGSGCGGGALSTCLEVEPCGGDATGNWKIKGGCFNSPAASAGLAADCPGASLKVSLFLATGAVTLSTDGSYTSSLIETIEVTELVPLSCTAGQARTCDDLTALFSGSTGVTGVCTGGTTCTCMLHVTQSLLGESGAYTAGGTTLSFTDSLNTTFRSIPYCVEGDRLHFLDIDTTMNAGPMGQATIVTDIVGQRQ
jgi:hypothetical protein